MSVAHSQSPELRVAFAAAQAAGKLLLKGASELTPEQISYKSAIDLVTDCDRQSEELIMKILEPTALPVFAEESQIFSLHDHIIRRFPCSCGTILFLSEGNKFGYRPARPTRTRKYSHVLKATGASDADPLLPSRPQRFRRQAFARAV